MTNDKQFNIITPEQTEVCLQHYLAKCRANNIRSRDPKQLSFLKEQSELGKINKGIPFQERRTPDVKPAFNPAQWSLLKKNHRKKPSSGVKP